MWSDQRSIDSTSLLPLGPLADLHKLKAQQLGHRVLSGHENAINTHQTDQNVIKIICQHTRTLVITVVTLRSLEFASLALRSESE